MKYTKIEQIAKGWSSYIWLVKAQSSKGEDCAQMPPGWTGVKKEVREKSNRKNLAEREGKMLKLANSIGVGPKLIEINFEENFVVMEYISGKKFLDFVFTKEFDEMKKEELYDFLKELIRQGLLLDEIGLRHNQLQVGKNILVNEKHGKYIPVIIDFEKGSLKENCKNNFGQLASFLFYNPNGAIAKKIREKLNLEL